MVPLCDWLNHIHFGGRCVGMFIGILEVPLAQILTPDTFDLTLTLLKDGLEGLKDYNNKSLKKIIRIPRKYKDYDLQNYRKSHKKKPFIKNLICRDQKL